MKVVCISDTHTMGPRITVPDGDVLIHAGDHTFRGTEKEISGALDWLTSLPHRHKLFIAGNHDFFFDNNAPTKFRSWAVRPAGLTRVQIEERKRELLAKHPTLTYLEDSSVEIEDLKFYGSPWQPWFWDWAFNFSQFDDGSAARKNWAKIPDDTDVLITHAPPAGILDRNKFDGPENHRAGCPELRNRVEQLSLIVHVFGHIHGGQGMQLGYGEPNHLGGIFVNAAVCNEAYEPVNPILVLDIGPLEDGPGKILRVVK